MSTHISEPHKLPLKAYKLIYDEFYKSLCLFSNKYVGNLDASKDIVQEVFIKIWEDEIEFKSENSIKIFLYTSVKNKSLNYIKTKKHKSTISLANIQIEPMEADSYFMREVIIEETHRIIENAISSLPNKCSKIIRLSTKNMSNIEIAKELDISINTVKAQKKIAYKRLRPLLKEHFTWILYVFLTQ